MTPSRRIVLPGGYRRTRDAAEPKSRFVTVAARAETLRFGISVVPATEQLDRIRELVRVADEAELDLVGIQDQPYQGRFLDTWSLIPTLLASTARISFFTDVGN